MLQQLIFSFFIFTTRLHTYLHILLLVPSSCTFFFLPLQFHFHFQFRLLTLVDFWFLRFPFSIFDFQFIVITLNRPIVTIDANPSASVPFFLFCHCVSDVSCLYDEILFYRFPCIYDLLPIHFYYGGGLSVIAVNMRNA